MTDSESSDRGSLADGIQINILQPYPGFFPTIVFPIPKNQPEATTSIELNVVLSNNAAKPLKFTFYQTLIPKVFSLDNQTNILSSTNQLDSQPQIRDQSEIEAILLRQHQLKPGLGINLSAKVVLAWQENQLQLRVLKNFSRALSTFGRNHFWCFEGLQPGLCRLQFSPSSELTFDLASETDAAPSQATQQNLPPYSYINLCIVHPTVNHKEAITVDGVQFRTEMPERVLKTPSIFERFKAGVKLAICVTNQTPDPIRFVEIKFIDVAVNLTALDGRTIIPHRRGFLKAYRLSYRLIQPGETTDFTLSSYLSWSPFNQSFHLAIANQAGGYFHFENLKPGRYFIQLMYHVSNWSASWIEQQGIEKVWSGWVVMPAVEFQLVY